jgi:hypothetical protein
MVRIFHTTLGSYVKNFENCIGLETLKKIQTVPDWIAEMRRINNQLANKAETLRSDESLLAPRPKLDDIVTRVNSRRQPKSIMTSDGPRDSRLPSTPAYSSKPNFTDRVQSRSTAPGFVRRDQSSSAGGGYRPFVRNSVIDHDYNLLDDTFDCPNPLLDSRGDIRKLPLSPIEQDEDGERDWDQEESAGQLDVMGQQSKFQFPTGSKTLFESKGRPTDPTRPCYKFFQDRCSDGDKCGWSHKLEDMRKLAQEKVDELFNSKFVVPEVIQSKLNQRRSNSTPNRNASVTRQYGTQELSEPSESDSNQIGNHSNQIQVQFESQERSNASQSL